MRLTGASRLGMLCGLACAGHGPALAQTPSPSAQIAAAVLPLPSSLRAGAGVVVLDTRGQPRELRPSANGMVCLADEPGDSTFAVECYPGSFIPLIYRMRQLIAGDMPESVLDQTIEAEARSGRLKLPTSPVASYLMSGPLSAYDWSTNTASDRIVVGHRLYIPYGTAAAMGLPTAEDGTHPYVMASGTYFAHVMIEHRPVRH
jgi:hypothetical protein